ncbi:unnamed protein product [Rhodiola kirilowii]
MAHISFFLSLLLILTPLSSSSSDSNHHHHLQRQTFIVHVSNSNKPHHFTSHHDWYTSILHSLPHPSTLLYTYTHSATGFSASLTPESAQVLHNNPAVLSLIPDHPNHIHTTRTPLFLGLTDSSDLWPNAHYADDVVVAVLDTGIWPERPSFSDEGLSPVPSSWKGICETGPDFPPSACNRKIIGARAYYKGYVAAKGGDPNNGESFSPRDTEGHGTHTASTAAGSVVRNASFFQYAPGIARGMATKARIAVYKICWSLGCYDSDILAAMDQAVADRVHVISLSVGSNGYAPSYDYDSIAIGAFGAAQNGVLVSCSAGNSGPGPYTAVNIAPWILTVGASTLDREFPADVILGDSRVFGGVSLYSDEPLDESIQLPLVYAANCGSRYCYPGDLNSSLVTGKLVVCDRGGNARVQKGYAVKLAGGVAMILANTEDSGEELIADSHLIPATMLGQKVADQVKSYIKTSSSPTGSISFKGTVYGTEPAPKVAAFSSRGPNYRTPEILKPDVIAPGVNILAGWTGDVGPTDLDIDPRRVEFNIISGTSMSCPHASGLAALLRKAHPNWSTSAIKSALMTTAYNLDTSGQNITDLATGAESTPFVHGAGHVDPNRALDPGLVYDIAPKDYISFLCSIGYSPKRIQVIVREPVDCSKQSLDSPGDLNYPSFSVVFESRNAVVKYKRSVRNVGSSADAVYKVEVNEPQSVEVSVEPRELVFGEGKETASYEVSFKSVVGSGFEAGLSSFGSIKWVDGVHSVRSPVAVRWQAGSVQSM